MDPKDAALLENDRKHIDDMRDPNVARLSRGPGKYELASRQAEEKRHTDELVSLSARFLDGVDKSFTRYMSADAREDAALQKAVRDTLLETAREEAKRTVAAMPWGKVILTTLELSNAFAAGVGAGIVDARAKVHGSNKPLSEIEEAVQFRKHLALAADHLDEVLLTGMAKLSDKVIEMLYAGAAGALKKGVAEVVSQFAKALPRHHDLFAILNADVKEQAGSIPHGRGGVERVTFAFASRLFVREYAGEDTRKQMEPVLKAIQSKDTIDVALAGGVLQILVDGTYREYKRHVHVDRAADELRAQLKDAARALLDRAKVAGASVEAGPLEATGTTIRLPQALLEELTSPTGDVSAATHSLILARQTEYYATRDRITHDLAELAKVYRRQVGRLPAQTIEQDEEIRRLTNLLVEFRDKAVQTLYRIERSMIIEFGPEPSSYGNIRNHLTGGRRPQHLVPVPELSPN